jgi:hypothetical protein
MTDHLYHISGLTDLDKTREYARERSTWGLATSGPNRTLPLEDKYILLHHHEKTQQATGKSDPCQGFKHEVYLRGELVLETTKSGEIYTTVFRGRQPE